MPFGTSRLNSFSLPCMLRQRITLIIAQATPSSATRHMPSALSAGASTSKCVGAILNSCVTPKDTSELARHGTSPA